VRSCAGVPSERSAALAAFSATTVNTLTPSNYTVPFVVGFQAPNVSTSAAAPVVATTITVPVGLLAPGELESAQAPRIVPAKALTYTRRPVHHGRPRHFGHRPERIHRK
jgi:hypothetical protein